jgi:hypothetical protein
MIKHRSNMIEVINLELTTMSTLLIKSACAFVWLTPQRTNVDSLTKYYLAI